MKVRYLIGLVFGMGLSAYACGTGTVANGPETDGGRKDTSAGSGYTFIAIYDMERVVKGADFSCSDDNSPGSDIDAVALIRNDEIIGYGLRDSATYSVTDDANQCKDDDCPDEDCKYTKSSKSLNGSDLMASTAGEPDAQINKNGDNKGYLSLNGGVLQIRIGNKEGKDPGQSILPGDKIKVFEVDLTKKTDSNEGLCAPERYQVLLQKSTGNDYLTLQPSQFDKANASVCGSSPNSDTQDGCGTTVFDVP